MRGQLPLDGIDPAGDRRLTERQRDLMRYMRVAGWVGGPMTPITAKAVRLFYADPWGALRRLERLGLVRRDDAGEWWPTT